MKQADLSIIKAAAPLTCRHCGRTIERGAKYIFRRGAGAFCCISPCYDDYEMRQDFRHEARGK